MTRTARPSVVTVLAAGLIVGVASPAAAAPVSVTTPDGIAYTADDADVAAGAAIVDYTGSSPTLVIPDIVQIGGTSYAVTAVGDSVFSGESFIDVTIGDNVTTIGNSSFANGSLESVTIGDSVTTIENSSFAQNPLTSITIPASVTLIETSAFGGTDLATVFMEGPRPSVDSPIWNTSPGPTVTYRWQFDASQVPGGYTATFAGSDAQPLATVAFDTAGGSAAPADEGVIVGSTIAEPTDPTRDGFTFDGWYAEPHGETAWDFSAVLDRDTLIAADTGESAVDFVLVARWTAAELADTGAETTGVASIAVGLLLAGALALVIRRRTSAAPVTS